MNTRNLIKLIRETKALLPQASPEQKIRFIKLIRESYAKLKESKIKKNVILAENNTDYLAEK